jgi:hypothetical protein
LERLFKDPGEKTPHIDFNHISGELLLSGKSIPENASQFFEPVLEWIIQYSKNPRLNTNLRLSLEYFNTASTIWLTKIVKCLSKIENPESVLMIHLYFDIEEFDSMDVEDVKDALAYVVDIVDATTISVGIKLYGLDEVGKTIKNAIVLV